MNETNPNTPERGRFITSLARRVGEVFYMRWEVEWVVPIDAAWDSVLQACLPAKWWKWTGSAWAYKNPEPVPFVGDLIDFAVDIHHFKHDFNRETWETEMVECLQEALRRIRRAEEQPFGSEEIGSKVLLVPIDSIPEGCRILKEREVCPEGHSKVYARFAGKYVRLAVPYGRRVEFQNEENVFVYHSVRLS